MEEQNSIQEETPVCSNCDAPLINKPSFCDQCGQKNTDGRLTVKELFSQFFDTLFNVDSKIFRTLIAVLIPGKLTNAFLSGKRQMYYHPIRLFLVLIVISLAAVNFQSEFTIPESLKKLGQVDQLKERKRIMQVFDASIDSIAKNTDQAEVHYAIDSLSKLFYSKSGKRIDSVNINGAMKLSNDLDFDFMVAVDDFGKYSPEEILTVYQVKGFYKRLMVEQKIKMVSEGTSFVPFVMGKVTWVVFFVLLLLSLIFKLLYFRSDFLYLEHLIFGIHLNSFFLILISIFSLFSAEIIEEILQWPLLLMLIYFFIALKRVYKQSYLLTSFKFTLLFVCYFFSFIFGLFITVVGSFLIF